MSLWLYGLYAFMCVLMFGGLAGYAALLLLAYRDACETAQASEPASGLDRWA